MFRSVIATTRSGLLAARRFSVDTRPQFLVNPETGFLPRTVSYPFSYEFIVARYAVQH